MLAWLVVAAQAASPPPKPLRVRPGEIASGVRCAAEPKFLYELYVPSRFSLDREWPILYVYDPRGRGRLAVDLFRPGAEARGFLVASSNDTESDNPDAPNAAAIRALWNDTHQRLPIAPTRRYAAGFSGGARLACSLGLAVAGELAGVFAVGGGFAPGNPPRRDLPFAVFGSVGTTDFNYYEMRQLDATLEKLGAAHRLEVFVLRASGADGPGGMAAGDPPSAGRDHGAAGRAVHALAARPRPRPAAARARRRSRPWNVLSSSGSSSRAPTSATRRTSRHCEPSPTSGGSWRSWVSCPRPPGRRAGARRGGTGCRRGARGSRAGSGRGAAGPRRGRRSPGTAGRVPSASRGGGR